MLDLLNDLVKTYPDTIAFAKKIQLILVHLRIYYLNSSIEVGWVRVVEEMLGLMVGDGLG